MGGSAPALARVLLGTQGWNYPDWVGPFFPDGTRAADFLRLYARGFSTVEVDSTFYAIPSESTVRGWAERTPPHFRFALKLPREITHERRLVGAEAVLEEFVERARGLGDLLGPVLVQLGPDFSPVEMPALRGFLPSLPPDVRFAVEFRQPGWITRETHDLLTRYSVALALSDGRWLPRHWLLALARRPTGGFHYVRWMGLNRDLTDFSRVQLDRTEELEAWAGALRDIPEGVETFGYFSNYFAGHSPASVRELQSLLGQTPVPPRDIGEQTSLF